MAGVLSAGLGVVMVAGCLSATTGPTGPTAGGARGSGPGTGFHPPDPVVRLPAGTTTTASLPPATPVTWTACGNLQCGTVPVPLDYADPAGPTIDLALVRHPALDPAARLGSIVINPGGPGTSGVDDLPNELSILGSAVLERFDIVSFDPRGVGRSSPVSCTPPTTSSSTVSKSSSSAAQKVSRSTLERASISTTGSSSSGSSGSSRSLGSLLSSGSSGGELDPTPTTVAGRQALVAYYRSLASACQAASGDELPFVGTVDDARDLDRIRAALGDQQLTYIGHSYGTLLGATYAAMFPAHVRAMVLDGAIDPALPMTQMVVQQAEGFEHALGDFFTWCAATASCPWRPVGDPTTALLALIARVTQAPLPAGGGQTAGPDEVYDGLLAGLGSQGNWPELGAALGQAEAGNGSLLTSSSNRYENGGSSNGAVAELAVDCLDHPVERNPADYPAMAVAAGSAAPVFGPLLTWGLLACAEWPALPTRTVGPASDTGAPPILVVGTTGDPVTPYKWAVALAQQLDHGDLLTWQGESHVASFSSACVRAAEQAYLLNGALPPTGTVCRD